MISSSTTKDGNHDVDNDGLGVNNRKGVGWEMTKAKHVASASRVMVDRPHRLGTSI